MKIETKKSDIAVKMVDVEFAYEEGKPNIIDKINLNIYKDEYVCILGHNGSGKSTITKLLCGLESPQKGEIFINGNILNDENIKKIRRDISVVFQNPDAQFIGATVEDDIAFGLENKCVPQIEMKPIILDVLAKVDMTDFINHEPTRLSGGQKQRVAIGSVLAIAPSIIIFDESTSMLDPRGRLEVSELIKKIVKQKHLTVISITHDMDQAAQADRLICIEKGRIIIEGTPAEVFANKEAIKQLKLDLPFAAMMADKLKGAGIDVGNALFEEDLVKCL